MRLPIHIRFYIITFVFVLLLGCWAIFWWSQSEDIVTKTTSDSEYPCSCMYDDTWELELRAYETQCVYYHHWKCFTPRNMSILKIEEIVECYTEKCLVDCDNINKTICKTELSKCQTELEDYDIIVDMALISNNMDKTIVITLSGIKNMCER